MNQNKSCSTFLKPSPTLLFSVENRTRNNVEIKSDAKGDNLLTFKRRQQKKSLLFLRVKQSGRQFMKNLILTEFSTGLLSLTKTKPNKNTLNSWN